MNTTRKIYEDLFGFSARDVNELNRKEFSIKQSLDEVICRSVGNGNDERFLRTAFGVNIEFASARPTSDKKKRRISYGQLEFESFVALIGDRKVKSENSAKPTPPSVSTKPVSFIKRSRDEENRSIQRNSRWSRDFFAKQDKLSKAAKKQS